MPPKSAFNDGLMRRGVITGENRLDLDRGLLGGIRFPAHCESCRAATSPWDDEYVRWVQHFAGGLHVLEGQGVNGMRTTINDARPGRFIRAALAGMTAVAEGLWETHLDLVKSILDGSGAPTTNTLRFLMAVTPTSERAVVTGIHRGAHVTISLTGDVSIESTPTPAAVIHHLPLSLILVEESVAGAYPHVDCTEWLTESVDGPEREVALEVPVVRIVAENPLHPTAFEIAQL